MTLIASTIALAFLDKNATHLLTSIPYPNGGRYRVDDMSLFMEFVRDRRRGSSLPMRSAERLDNRALSIGVRRQMEKRIDK